MIYRITVRAKGLGRAMKDLRIWTKRVILLLIGLTIAHLGVTLFLLADLGSDPFNVHKFFATSLVKRWRLTLLP